MTISEQIGNPSTAGNTANAVYDAAAARYYSRTGTGSQFTTWTLAVAAGTELRAILLQKWVSLTHINGLEQWSDYRKANNTSLAPNLSYTTAGIPATPYSVTATTKEPVRYLYPQAEYDNNSNNVPQGIDRFTTKIFWDVN